MIVSHSKPPKLIAARDVDAAWLAGLFDGEGTVSIIWKPKAGTHGAWQVMIRIPNSHLPALEAVVRISGMGKISKARAKPGRKQMYIWRAAGAQAESVALLMLPYLVIKREQSQEAIRAADLLRNSLRVSAGPRTGRPRITVETHRAMADARVTIQRMNGNRNSHLALTAMVQ